MKIFFKDVYCAKPKSSRNSSQEAFIIGKGFKYSEGNPLCNGSLLNPALDAPEKSNKEEEEKKGIDKSKSVDYGFVKRFVNCGDISTTCEQPVVVAKEETVPPTSGLVLNSSLTDYMNLFN